MRGPTNFTSGEEYSWCVHNQELTLTALRPRCEACELETAQVEVVAVKDGMVTIRTINKGVKK